MLLMNLTLLHHLFLFIPSALAVYGIIKVVYNLYFHPLAQFPGPILAAISNIPYSRWFLSGRQPYKLHELHTKYGPIVRTAPNELSFNTAESWRDIYGFRSDHKIFVKGKFYSGGSYAGIGTRSVVSETNPHTHRQMRSYLAGAFSERSVLEHEYLVSESVDKFVRLVGTKGRSPAGFDISALLEMLTFDITGDLAFGKSFGCLDNDMYHPWISVTIGALTQGAIVDVLDRFPWIARIALVLFRKQIHDLTEDTRKNEAMSLDAVRRRILSKSTRKDFLSRILTERDPTLVSDQQIAAHASDLVIAGSDTSASALAACIYYLLKEPVPMYNLVTEVRCGFNQYSDITGSSTSSMQYLNAVLQEALRLFPPLPLGLPRIVPAGGAVVDEHVLPEGITVSTNPLAACLSSDNFENPLQFNPERWLGTNRVDNCTASQPFGLGSRACIGRNLAWMEMRTTLAKLVWMYDFEFVDQAVDWHRDTQMHTLWRKPELRIRASRRSAHGDES
ncbi:putative cytochrome P450 [Truncatella angustata]|uniref:Cytochrome P450 n=1 Tax=Truncatella angustata TaxID=152316 RepID=A0A9P8UUQ3_9PEZI|nr:putative cytochrome P450 [Truncatella angustata]KAH6658724.1 putative cytochrome P450 [Truncatella angustata]